MKFKFWFYLLPGMVILASETTTWAGKAIWFFKQKWYWVIWQNGSFLIGIKMKKKINFSWGSISLYITTPWCFINIKIYNSNFPFQATDSDYLIFQIINLETRQISNHKNIYWHVSVDWNLRQVALE